MVDQCKSCFIHPNKYLREVSVAAQPPGASGRLCSPVTEHYSITQRAPSGDHAKAARAVWEDILSSGAFEVSLSSAAGSLKHKTNKKPQHKTIKPKQTTLDMQLSQLLQEQHVNSRLH